MKTVSSALNELYNLGDDLASRHEISAPKPTSLADLTQQLRQMHQRLQQDRLRLFEKEPAEADFFNTPSADFLREQPEPLVSDSHSLADDLSAQTSSKSEPTPLPSFASNNDDLIQTRLDEISQAVVSDWQSRQARNQELLRLLDCLETQFNKNFQDQDLKLDKLQESMHGIEQKITGKERDYDAKMATHIEQMTRQMRETMEAARHPTKFVAIENELHAMQLSLNQLVASQNFKPQGEDAQKSHQKEDVVVNPVAQHYELEQQQEIMRRHADLFASDNNDQSRSEQPDMMAPPPIDPLLDSNNHKPNPLMRLCALSLCGVALLAITAFMIDMHMQIPAIQGVTFAISDLNAAQ